MENSARSEKEHLSITDLPALLIQLFERSHYPLLAGTQGPLGLFVRYLRRKPERGLAIIYAVDETHATRHTRANTPGRSVSLTIDEQALDGSHIRGPATPLQQAHIDLLPSGVIHLPQMALFAQKFPADEHLPTLTACCDTRPQGPLFHALEAAARKQLRDTSWHLRAAQAYPVRYKPANRCVIRYELELEHPAHEQPKALKLFGKTYADLKAARHTQSLQQQLYQEQMLSAKAPILPAPLGIVDELHLTLCEAVEVPQTSGEDQHWGRLRTGTQALRPAFVKGKGGTITEIIVPEEELRLAAQILARLHTSVLRPDEDKPRTGTKEAKRARERARLIAEHNPEQRTTIQRLAEQLAEKLEAPSAINYGLAHGGFKASQLLFHSHNVYVVDFDGICLADPALDVGYFLAYLRPSGLWYQRPGMRQWFEDAASIFLNAYQQALLATGVALPTVTAILERSRAYEAALIFKIAARRANRLNSPRAGELAAMLEEIGRCLSDKRG